VAAALRRRILAGEFTPGGPFLSRRGIAGEFDVGLGVAQQALSVLRADGLVEGPERHRPTVAHPPAVRVLTDAAAPWPYGVGERHLARAAVKGEGAALLDLADGTRVQRERIELLDPDGRTSHLVVRYTLRRKPAAGQYAVADTSARGAGPGEAGMLGVAIGSILLVVRVVRYARDGRPAAVDELLLPADRWRVRLG
jgi:DNA-binding GntR family transcriptional regulator